MITGQHNVKVDKDEPFQNSSHRSNILQFFEKEIHAYRNNT